MRLVDRALVVVLSIALLGSGATAAIGAGGESPQGATPPVDMLRTANVQKSKVSLNMSHTVARKGEQVWMAGKVRVGSKAAAGREVIIERAKGKGWTKIASVKTRSNGKFTLTIRPTVAHTYRARIAKTSSAESAVSASKRIKFSAKNRTLKARVSITGARLGTATTKVKSLSVRQRKATKRSGVKSVQFREYSKASVVKVRTTNKTRAWLVMGKIRSTYKAAGGPTGKYGIPLQDARCDLLEGGCIQRFSKGTIYSNNSKKKATATNVKGRKGEVIAAARSQVGNKYRYLSGSHTTKYNSFVGTRNAWCSFLQSWASEASGNGALLPKKGSFTSYLTAVRGSMKLGTKPKVGALAFMSTRAPHSVANHVGLVVGVSGSKVRIVDGNTRYAMPYGYRGVTERVMARGEALYYAYPKY